MTSCGALFGDFMARTAFGQSCGGPHRLVVRYVYGFIFLLTNVAAWMVRDYSHKALAQFHYFKGCEGGHDCLGSEGVLRVSLGCFIFFFTMYLTTVGTEKVNDPRDSWHAGWWPIKTLLWIALIVAPFFVPPAFIQFYGEMARFGAGIFLLIQLLSVINFMYWWNEDWLSDKKARRCRLPMVVVTAGSFAAALSGIVLMYLWFAPKISCHLNIFLITLTLIMIQLMTSISLHSKVNAGLMTSGLMAIYIVFLCWSAIMSEPLSVKCNTRPRQTGKGDWVTIVSFAIAVLAIVVATMTTGTDSECFTFKHKEKSRTEEDVPYGYGFFHFVFSMGAMYFGMLFVGWNLHQTMHKYAFLGLHSSSSWFFAFALHSEISTAATLQGQRCRKVLRRSRVEKLLNRLKSCADESVASFLFSSVDNDWSLDLKESRLFINLWYEDDRPGMGMP